MAIRCENCGHVAPTDDRFCSKCGAPLPAAEAPEEPAPNPEDSSWVSLAGEPGQAAPPPAPTAFVAPPLVEPDEAPQPSAPIPPPSHEPVNSYDDPPPPPARTRDKGLWIAVVVVGIVGALALVVWTMNWAGTNDNRIEIAEESDDPSAPGLDEWRTGYTDIFLSQDELTLVTSGQARQRDFPTTEGTTVQRTLPANSQVTGRWVRGRDPTTKWLKLAGGGYIWEGNLAQPGGQGSPIAIALTNKSANYGPDIAVYLDRAQAQQRAEYARIERLPKEQRDAAMGAIETRSAFVSVPVRRWRGLTVTAVGQHYEGQSIYFREDVATVRAAFAAAGIRLDGQGIVDLPEEEAVGCSISENDWDDSRQFGGTALTCGV